MVHAASRPEDWLRFVQIDPFPRMWGNLGLNDEDLRALEILIMSIPENAAVIPGTNGLRKLRFARAESPQGKRGGYRVFFVYVPEYGIVLLMAIIAKSKKADLTKADLNALSQVILRYQKLLEQGVIR